ncbi:cancer-related regulator of actin dynamics, partial [Fukomys damarensis]|uniref:cancer-related regulator of actin dynamics n=1 Tax=Fukomys damarensis TaxID=885580 RepID=UPI0014552AF0
KENFSGDLSRAKGLSSVKIDKKKGGKFQSFKKLFGKRKKKDPSPSREEAVGKKSYSPQRVSNGTFSSDEETLEDNLRSFNCSVGTRVFSHDSIFIPDGGAESEQTVQAMSQDNILGKVKTLQRQLGKNIKFGQQPPNAIPMKKAGSGKASSKEDLFLTSPMETVTQQDIILSDTENKSSDSPSSPGPLNRPGAGSEMEDKVAPVKPSRPKRHLSSAGTIESVNLDAIPLAIARLDNSAAKHKLSVKPKNQRVSKKHRRLAWERQNEPGLESQPSLDQDGQQGEERHIWHEEEPEPLGPEEEKRRQEHYWQELEAKCKRQKAEAAEKRRLEEQRLQALERRLWEENRRQELLEEGEEEEGEEEQLLLEAEKEPQEEGQRQGLEEQGCGEQELREQEERERSEAEEQRCLQEEAEHEAERQQQEEERELEGLRRLEEHWLEEEEEARRLVEEARRLEELRQQEELEAERRRDQEEEERLQELTQRRQQQEEEAQRREELEQREEETEVPGQQGSEEEEPWATPGMWEEEGQPQVRDSRSLRSPPQNDSGEKPEEQDSVEPKRQGESSEELQSQEARPTGERLGPRAGCYGEEPRVWEAKSEVVRGEPPQQQEAPIEEKLKNEAAAPKKERRVEELRWQEVEERQTMPRPYTFQVSSGGRQILFPKVNLSPVTPAAQEPKAPRALSVPHLRRTPPANAKFFIMPAWQKFSDAGSKTARQSTEADSLRKRTAPAPLETAPQPLPAAPHEPLRTPEKTEVRLEPADTTEGCKFAKDLPSFLVPSPPPPAPKAAAHAEPRTSSDFGSASGVAKPDPVTPGGEEKASPFGIKLRRTNYSLRFHCDQQAEQKKKKRHSSMGDSMDATGEREAEGAAPKPGPVLPQDRKQAPSPCRDSAASPARTHPPGAKPSAPPASSQAPAAEQDKAASRTALVQKPALAPKPAGHTPPSSPLTKISRPYLVELLARRAGKPDPEPSQPPKENQESRDPQPPSPPPPDERKGQKTEPEEEAPERKSASPPLTSTQLERLSQTPEAARKEKPVLQSRHSLDGSKLMEKVETAQPLWITLALQKQKGFREQQATREERKQAREAKQAEKLSKENAGISPQPGSSSVRRAGSLHKSTIQLEEKHETAVSRLERREQLQKANTLPTSVTVEISDSAPPAPLVKEVPKRFSTPDAAPVSTEPAWLALAKRKAKAWSDCPQIIK